MERYFVNNQVDTNPNNDHEVHVESCHLLPLRDGRDLDMHNDCHSAVVAARRIYDRVDGCRVCSPDCHRS